MNPVLSILRWLSGALFSLCGGAMWAVLLLVLPRFAPWFAVVAALIAVFALRFTALSRVWSCATSAAAFFLLATAYAAYLRAAVLVARSVGFELGKVLAGMGGEMACAVTLAHSGRDEAIAFAAGLGLALALGARAARRRGTPAAASFR